MPKPELELFSTDELPWSPMGDGKPGMYERVLAVDHETGSRTQLSKWDPGTNVGVQAHPYWEEVFILEGSIRDLTLGKTFSKGFYCCRPPGMVHGPYESTDGIIEIEIRHYAAPSVR